MPQNTGRIVRFIIAAGRKAALPLFFLALASLLHAQPSNEGFVNELGSALDKAVSNYWKPSVLVVLGTFTWRNDELASPFSRWLEDGIRATIPRTRNLRLLDARAAAAMDPALRNTYAELFASAQVDAILYGRFFDEGSAVRVHLDLTGLSDGALIGSTQIVVPLSSLPSGLGIRPDRKVAVALADLLHITPPAPAAAVPATSGASASVQAAQDPRTQALHVSVSTDRGTGAAYRAGERLGILVTVNQRAWVKVYQVDVAGKTQLIWPNRYSGTARPLDGGSVVRIPSSSDPFSFILGPPYGTEFIKVVASSQAFTLTEAEFADLAGAARESIGRGMSAEGAPDRRAETLASYLILE